MLKEIWKVMLVVQIVLITLIVRGTASNSNKLGGIDAAQYVVKGNFAVVETSVNITENGGIENFAMDYPSGFNVSNCVILTIGLSNSMVSNHWGYDLSYTGIKSICPSLYSSDIGGSIECNSDYGAGQKQTIKIVLMKIK